MKNIELKIFLAIGLLIVFTTSVFASVENKDKIEGDLIYTVHPLQKGETLSHLALSYYGTISRADFLAEYNNIDNVRRIHAGREIKIPSEILYQIKFGDSLSKISQNLLGSWKKFRFIAEYNNLPDPNLIVVGRRLRIPIMMREEKPTAVPEEVVEHKEPEVKEEEEEKPPAEPEKPAIEIEEKPSVETKEPVVSEEPKEPPKPVEEKPVPEKEKEEVPQPPEEEKKPEPPVEVEEEEKPKPEEIKIEKPPTPDIMKQYRLTEVKKPEPEIPAEPAPSIPETEWPPVSPWGAEEAAPEEEITEPERLSPILDALKRWDREIKELDIKDLEAGKRRDDRDRERGVKLPMHSLLQIDGYKSITIEYNKTHYFGDSDINRYSGYYSGGTDYSSYYDYDPYGSGYSSYGSSYNSYGSYGDQYNYGYGTTGRSEGPNIEQELEIHLHGRIGLHTHVDVDYNDTGRSQFGGMGQKEQKIAVWYAGDEEDIIKKASFGDIRLNLPSSRFLNMSRDLFGAEVVAELAGVRLTAFGTRTKGIKETWSSKGESRRSGGGTGSRIMDVNYIKEKYYAINVGEDGEVHDSYLPIESNSEQIYMDDGIGTNNDSGISTARGYFDYQYPGDDYTIDYTTGRIEFLKNISTNYRIVVAYKYRGIGGGEVGNPEATFLDDNENGVIDEEGEASDPLGYVVIKDSGQHGSELRNAYSLGNSNINRRNFDLSIWREGGTDSFNTDDGAVAYARIFGLDSDNDGLVDPELIDFEKGLLTFPSQKPFMIEDPNNPYYEYREELNNQAIYSENPRYTDQKYILQADYSYQMRSFYLGRLNILPDSEEVRVNGSKLKRGVDYMMVNEVGSIEIFKELDEYDEITVDYEYMPFGGQFQQTIAGVWAEYSFTPKKKIEPKTPADRQARPDSYGGDMSPFSQGMGTGTGMSRTSSYGSNYGSSYDSSYGSGYGQSSYGDSFDSGYGGYSSYSGRRGTYDSSGLQRRTPSFGGTTSVREGLNLSMGYIYNTGERSTAIPDVNSVPSRLQALVMTGNWGHQFDVAKVLGLLPFISPKGKVPLALSLDGEAAYSRNNPNSVGYAMIDSMEGAKDSSKISTYKFSWQLGSVPISYESDINVDNRAIFQIASRDKDASYGNYMKNRETSAAEINPLSRATEQHLVMEMGYELDENASWGSLSYPISKSGADYSNYEFLEIWVKVDGDDSVNLHIDYGVVSEDTDNDFRLDSEDLPGNLIDENGDNRIDVLDLDKTKLPEVDKYKGNGRLDLGEDTGWTYNDLSGDYKDSVGRENTLLDAEDLDGDVVLDTTDSYYEFTIPLDAVPSEWIRKTNSDTGWMFLSIPIEAAEATGRSPSWGLVKHSRIWLEKTAPGLVKGKLQWYSISLAGNRWNNGLVVDETGKLSEKAGDQMLIGTKNNYEFEDYLSEYEKIADNKDFEVLHPYVESAFSYEEEKKEQSLTLSYKLQPGTTGYTMRELSGQRTGDGQDFSKHGKINLWFHGDGSGSIFIMRLGSNVDDFGAGSPVTTDSSQTSDSYSYYSYARYSGRGYYEYSRVIDFTGWRLIAIPLDDSDGDGHPDSMKMVSESNYEPSLSNIGRILVGIRNDKDSPIDGEVWVNEIHLSNPYVKSGWARRFNLTTSLANIFNLRAGYAKQDSDFENSAGQTGRSSLTSRGYSTSNYDYNVDTELRVLQWLPIGFRVSHRESESKSLYGMISSYESGLTKTDNRTFSIRFDKAKLPGLSFSYDNQEQWNENRGLEISDLYSSNMAYALSIISLKMDYSHEFLSMERDSSISETTSSYYYGTDTDSIVDSGGISLQISPTSSFSINPSYDVRRELQRELVEEGESEGGFEITAREQRISLRPTLRHFWGIKPSISGRYSFTEDWFRDEKDASINTDLGFGINFKFRDWFTSGEKAVGKVPNKRTDSGRKEITEQESVNDQENLDQENLDQEGVDEFRDPATPQEMVEMMDERAQEERGNWIEKEKNELKGKIRERSNLKEKASDKGILRRSLESFTLNTDVRFNLVDYLRGLERNMGFSDILKLEPESELRTRSTKTTRYSVRSNVDPLSWVSLGANISLTNRFTKSSGTASDSDSSTIGGDMKFFNARSTSSLMLKYDMTKQDSGNRSGNISSSTSHNQSVTVSKTWSSGVGSSMGFRTTLRDYERGGVTTKSKIFAPNFSIDYDLRVKGDLRLPLIRRSISLDHDLDVSNTLSAMVRREKLGVNRDEKSEQYGTSLNVSYDLKERIRATMRFSVDYNHDRVEEGADYLAVSGSLMLRGEFK